MHLVDGTRRNYFSNRQKSTDVSYRFFLMLYNNWLRRVSTPLIACCTAQPFSKRFLQGEPLDMKLPCCRRVRQYLDSGARLARLRCFCNHATVEEGILDRLGLYRGRETRWERRGVPGRGLRPAVLRQQAVEQPTACLALLQKAVGT